jgi:hypothetical protein
MRYKVTTTTDSMLDDVQQRLASRVTIYVVSEKRRTLSTDDIPIDLLKELTARGATGSPTTSTTWTIRAAE